MIPFALTALFNATSAANGGLYDRSLAGGYVSLTEPATFYTVVNPDDCSFTDVTARPSFVGAGDSCGSFPDGSVAISIVQFCLDSLDWMYYCSGGQWTSYGADQAKTMTTWATEDKTVVSVRVDKEKPPSTTPEQPAAWQLGELSGLATMNKRCDDTPPHQYNQGGALTICLDSMTMDSVIGLRICSHGNPAYDTPACATASTTHNTGSVDARCPVPPDASFDLELED